MAEEECPKCKAGLPGWLATFADLMSLLMCFFVLLLSFATIDAVKFKKMAESMKDAFGVQREIPAAEIVMGVSVIKREFSPTIAEESIVEQVKQQTTDTVKENLEMKDKEKTESNDAVDPAELKEQQLKEQLEIKMIQEAKEQVEELQQALSEEIDKGQVTVEREGSRVIIRIQEKGSFKSGSASLDPEFYEVMDKITSVLVDRSGQIVVSGHTDNIPISTGRFRSNWELSSARAVTVLHAMLRNPDIDQSRVVVKGHADTKPMVDNDTPEHRAQNRRVELHVIKGIANDDDTQESILQN
jgi:chemotaxis protein MotB